MNSFISLACFMLATSILCCIQAAPDVSSISGGYHYNRNSGSVGGGGGGGSDGTPTGGNYNYNGPSASSNTLATPHHQYHHNRREEHHQQQPIYQRASSSGGATMPEAFSRGDKYLPPSSPATTMATPIITKQFYMISAPDDHDDMPIRKHFVLGRPQKNYRVVFIKAPSSENGNIKFTAEYAPQEEKTVIYVLTKKDKELDVSEIATPAPTQPTKPEVFFIKYKTPEEASAAQKEIQEQYDHLGGTTEYTDEGVAPIKSVIGSLDVVATNGGYDYKKASNGVNTPSKEYLPPRYYY